jgi:hypothetical protein
LILLQLWDHFGVDINMTHILLAAITNPALPAAVGTASTPVAAAGALGYYIAILWRTAIILGGLGVIIYLIAGGFYWITAGGEKGKIEEAKERIMQAIVGFAVLTAVSAVSVFLSQAFGIDLLRPNFSVLSGAGGGGGGGGGQPAGSCPTVDPAVYGYIANGAYACYTVSPKDCRHCVNGAYTSTQGDPNCPAACK